MPQFPHILKGGQQYLPYWVVVVMLLLVKLQVSVCCCVLYYVNLISMCSVLWHARHSAWQRDMAGLTLGFPWGVYILP